jgi:signal transduction histidine kinase
VVYVRGERAGEVFLNPSDIFIKIKETLAGSILETGSRVTADFSKAKKIEYPRSYLESIMLNLLSNAIKYRSPERIPEIHFQTKYHNGQAILTVSDNGLGIDLQIYGDQLFNLNKTFHEHPEAKGVGLFITRTQVEAMGGSISAESKVDEGTTFIVVL